MRLRLKRESMNGRVVRAVSFVSALGFALISASSPCAARPLVGDAGDAGDQAAPAATPSVAPAAFHPTGVWVACDDRTRIAYRVVPPALNPHAAFTHPIKVKLRPSESCQDLK